MRFELRSCISSVILASGLLMLRPLPVWAGDDAPWVVASVPELTKRIDALHSRYDAPYMPGAIVAILKGDQIVLLKGYGAANREFNVPWDPDIRYTFYSTTKSMTSMAVMKLADRGSLRLDDSVRTVLSDLPAILQPVTIRHLLNHTSGIWQDEQVMSFAGLNVWPYDQHISADEMYAVSRRQDSVPYAPGTNYYYNDAGLRLAARIVERVTGMSFRDAIKQMVFDPAGMTTADIKGFEPAPYPRSAATYFMDELEGRDPSTTRIGIANLNVETTGDGSGVGTIKDYIAYARYLNQRQPNGRTWLERLTEPVPLRSGRLSSYRYGFKLSNYRGLTVFSHGGLWGKKIIYIPQLDAWILYMRNALDYKMDSEASREASLIDAYLESDPKGRFFLSAKNPLRDRTLWPEDQHFTEAELKSLAGTFWEPQSGKVVRLRIDRTSDHAQVVTKFLGTEEMLVRGPSSGHFASYDGADNPIELTSKQGQLRLTFADWQSPRPLNKIVEMQSFSPVQLQTLPGLFRSTAFGSTMEIVRTPGGLELHIGSGLRIADRFILRPVTAKVLEGVSAAGVELTLHVDEVNKQEINMDMSTVQGLRFQRVQSN